MKKPRILLVQPTTIHLDGTPHKTRWRLIMGLMIPLMAGLTPDDYDVTLCDERLEELDFDGGWDLVGMTTTIGASLRAYQLGDEFRKRGIPVVMGGFHATLQTEEALKHADAVVQGEADLVWEGLLQDWRDGKLKQIYKADKLHDLKNLPRPRHELLKLNKYLFKAVPVQASRGCPYRCSFCEIPVFYSGSYRTRPIEDIVEEIKQVIEVTGFRRFQFIDDQITGKHKFAKELFRALEPLNIQFSCLWTVNSNHDDELLALAAKAGVFHVNIGVESISQDSLLSMNKIQNHAKDYKKLLQAPRASRHLLFAQFPLRARGRPSANLRGYAQVPARGQGARGVLQYGHAARGHPDAHAARGRRPRDHSRRRYVHEQLPLHVRAEESLAAAGRGRRLALHEGVLLVQVDVQAAADAARQVHLAGTDREHALLVRREASDRSGRLLLGQD